MDEQMVKVMKRHNGFIRCLVKAQKLWDKLREEYALYGRDTEVCSAEVQRFISSFGLSEFYTMMPRLMDYARMYGGLEQFIQEFPEPEPEEPEVDWTTVQTGLIGEDEHADLLD